MNLKTIMTVAFIAAMNYATAQSKDKDCKFERFKDQNTGNMMQLITVPTKVGKFMVGRNGDKLIAAYTLKGIFAWAGETKNTVRMRIDSVQFVFEGQLVNIPVIGTGNVINEVKLKPRFESVNYSFAFPENTIEIFAEKKIIGFKIFGEKEAETGDLLNEEQAAKFIKAINCSRQ
jgi:hypothetical protein